MVYASLLLLLRPARPIIIGKHHGARVSGVILVLWEFLRVLVPLMDKIYVLAVILDIKCKEQYVLKITLILHHQQHQHHHHVKDHQRQVGVAVFMVNVTALVIYQKLIAVIMDIVENFPLTVGGQQIAPIIVIILCVR